MKPYPLGRVWGGGRGVVLFLSSTTLYHFWSSIVLLGSASERWKVFNVGLVLLQCNVARYDLITCGGRSCRAVLCGACQVLV